VDGVYTYTDLGVCTTEVTLTFSAHDGTNTSNSATITLTLNLPPIAEDDSKTLDEGGTLKASVSGTDPEAQLLTYTLVKSPLYGTLTFNNDGTYTYTHDGSEHFDDSFTFYVNDGTLDSNTATVTLTITPINEAPSAEDDQFIVDEEGTLEESATGHDPEKDRLSYILVSDVQNGTLTLYEDGTFTYQHNGSKTTTDRFTFKVNDGKLDSNTATVTITITLINEAPSGEPETRSIEPGKPYAGQLEGTDPDNDELTFEVVDQPEAGELTLNPDGSYTFVPPLDLLGPFTFTYHVCDGIVCSDPITVTFELFGTRDDELPETGEAATWPYILVSGLGLWLISQKKHRKKTT
jgi:VCBS repeat-containing protein